GPDGPAARPRSSFRTPQPGQVRKAVAWQATTLALAALAIGVPLGVLSGRLIWARFANQLGVLEDAVVPIVAIALIMIGSVALANLIALGPARIAGKTRSAHALRAP